MIHDLPRMIVCVTALLLCVAPFAMTAEDGQPQGRPRVSLAGPWEVQFVEEATGKADPKAKWGSQQLPGRLRMYRGKTTYDAAWLRRKVGIPADWKGRRVVANFFRVMWACTVHVDGKPVAEVPAYGRVVDLTGHVVPGKTHEIMLRFGRKGMGHVIENKAVADLIAGVQAQVDHGGWDRGTKRCGLFGQADQFYLESRPLDLVVEDVWYRTATRGMVRIEPEMTVVARKPGAGLTAVLRVYEADAPEVALEHEIALGPLEPGRNVICGLVRAEKLKLWDIGRPNLYRGQVIVKDADGREVDRTEPTVFGVREFWIQGRHTMLNGHRVHFVIDWGNPSEKAKYGSTLIESSIPWEARHMSSAIGEYRAADRLGVAMEAHGIIHHLIDVGDPEIAEDYRAWWAQVYPQIRNHPSVVVYGIGINSPGNFLDFDPWKIGQRSNLAWSTLRTSLSYQLHKDVAPRCAFYFHGGPRGGDISTGNLYMNHIPTQEVEDWFSIWARNGDMPVMLWEGMGAALNVDYKKGGLGLATEFNAIRFGEEAYAQETDRYLSYCNYTLPRTGHWENKIINYSPLAERNVIVSLTRGHRAWRYYGVPFKSWAWTYDNKPILDADRAVRAPDLAWIGGPEGEMTRKDHNFFSGDRIEKSACLIHDRAEQGRWRLQWRLSREGVAAPVLERTKEVGIGAFAHNQETIVFDAPEVAAPTRFVLRLTVTDVHAQKQTAFDTLVLTIYPRRKPAGESLTVAAVDPRGETTRMLEKRGVTVRPHVAGEKPAGGILVIGRGALTGRRELPFTAEQVAGGLRVVVFEQHCPPLGALGFRHEDVGPRRVFARMPDHPITRSLAPEALHDWRGSGTLLPDGPRGDRQAAGGRLYHCLSRGTVASDIIATPEHGPFYALLDCEFDLGFTPLMVWPHGRGEVIFCQLDVTGRVNVEPAATQIIDQLRDYLASPPARAQNKMLRCFGDAGTELAARLGFAADRVEAAEKLDPQRDVLVVPWADAEALAKQRAAVSRFAGAGGDVLVLYGDKTLPGGTFFGEGWKLESVAVTRAARQVEAHPLLRGVGPQNIHWRMPVRLTRIAAAPEGARTLLGGFAAVRPVGKGRVVLLQVDPAAFEDAKAAQEADPKEEPLKADRILYSLKRSRWHVARLHSLVLANLGVRSSDALAARVTSMRWTIPMKPINRWVFFGPYAPADEQGDPLDRGDIEELGAHRDLRYKARNARGETMMWHVPNDAMHGMGVNGQVELSDVFGVRLRDTAVAITHVWSTRPREATIEVGADWWMRIDVNGKKVFRTTRQDRTFGVRFGRPTKVQLKQGWNEIRVVCAAGSNGHVFWFRMTDPGDLVVAQSPTVPKEPPTDLPPVDRLLPEERDTGYSLYEQRELSPRDDPYSFVPW